MKNSSNKESQIYLSFLRENLVILSLALIIGGAAGLLYHNILPKTYSSNLLLQMDFTEDNIRNRLLLTDQATTILRSPQIQSQLKINPDNKLVVYKSGPLAITVSSIGSDSQTTQQDVSNVLQFAKQAYPLKLVGETITSIKTTSVLIHILIGGLLGGILGLTISLVKSYLRNY